MTLPAELSLGPVHITVTDLDRSVEFYERSLGLGLRERHDRTAQMGPEPRDVLVLHEKPDGRPAGRHAGLYHFALLNPSREELARAAQRLLVTRTPISGASDHGISEAIYLPDPDGNGIELAADRSREHWGDLRDPTAMGGPEPLDLNALLGTVAGEEEQPRVSPELVVGHLHLHVGDLEQALSFYRDVIGFEVMTLLPTAAFIAAGGYHHHLGLNTWRGQGAPPAPEDAVGLDHWTVELPEEGLNELRGRLDSAEVAIEGRDGGFLVRDPWNTATLFRTRSDP